LIYIFKNQPHHGNSIGWRNNFRPGNPHWFLVSRHPKQSQHSATEYLAMIRAQGFIVSPQNVWLPCLWWSRPDVGAFEFFGLNAVRQTEPTLINLVALKPE
jgi:hypothetical protein